MRNLAFYKILPQHKRVLDSKTHRLPHYIYPTQQMEKIQVTHLEPKKFSDRLALKCVKTLRLVYDMTTRYDFNKMNEIRWMNRCIFLQTIAGVPGMVGGMCRHLQSIRKFQQDKGFIHHLIEQADNERFHLFLFLHLRKPSFFMRSSIIISQGVFMNAFFIAYLFNPRFCHRFVGYLEQEACKTYTSLLSEIDRVGSPIHAWNKMKAPQQAIDYYHLDKNATMREVILSIRADEATHRQTNHFLSQVEKTYEMQEEQVFKEDDKKTK